MGKKKKIIIAIIIIVILIVGGFFSYKLFLYIKSAINNREYNAGEQSYTDAIAGSQNGKVLSKTERDQLYNNAISNLEIAQQKDPKNLNISYQLASAYQNTGDIDKSIESLIKISEQDNQNANLFLTLGNLYRTKSDLGVTTDNYQKAISLNPNLIEAYINLASVYEINLNQKDAAIKVLQDGLSKNPDNNLLKQELERLNK